MCARHWSRSRTYGLTPEDLVRFEGPCEACGAPSTAVDHDHSTGEPRGPLCNGCNVALGQVQDDPDRLRALALYLEKYSSKESRS